MSTHRSSDYSKPVHTIWTDPDVSWNDKSFESTSNKVRFIKIYIYISIHIFLINLYSFYFQDTCRKIFSRK